MKFLNLLENFKTEQKILHITFGEKFSLNCKIIETHEDFIRVNLVSFNKAEQTYNTTSNFYSIPNASIVLIEEYRQR
jgi:hypothetical protein